MELISPADSTRLNKQKLVVGNGCAPALHDAEEECLKKVFCSCKLGGQRIQGVIAGGSQGFG